MDAWTDDIPGFDVATEMLDAADGSMNQLPEPVRIFLRVHGAQGTIDNGGFRYFFEEDWPDTPPYSEFIKAYEAIGCFQQAAELQRIVETFPFEDPHLHKAKRNEFMEANYDQRSHCVRGWGNSLCGDTQVLEKLATYYKLHRRFFVPRTFFGKLLKWAGL